MFAGFTCKESDRLLESRNLTLEKAVDIAVGMESTSKEREQTMEIQEVSSQQKTTGHHVRKQAAITTSVGMAMRMEEIISVNFLMLLAIFVTRLVILRRCV